jgi:hypothetical protein
LEHPDPRKPVKQVAQEDQEDQGLSHQDYGSHAKGLWYIDAPMERFWELLYG